ncbi:MAG: hypothetical protein V2A73_00390 [Pseudomonadota bacterium]
MQGLYSRSRAERQLACKRLVRRLADDRRLTLAHLAEVTGHSLPVLRDRLDDAEVSEGILLSDLGPLTEELGSVLLESFAGPAGYLVVGGRPHSRGFVELAAAAVSSVSGILDRGLTSSEATILDRDIEEVRRSLDELRARVASSVRLEDR